MSVRVYADALDLPMGLLRLEEVQPKQPNLPYPRLSLVGVDEVRTFRTLVLENDFLRVTVLPALGGRIWSVLDLRNGRELLARDATAMPVAGGRRGAVLQEGIQVFLRGEDRMSSLGGVFSDVEEPDEDSETVEAAIWVGEFTGEAGLAFHQRISMSESHPGFKVEVRVTNRLSLRVDYDAGLRMRVDDAELMGTERLCWFRRPSARVAASLASSDLATMTHEGRLLSLHRCPGPMSLEPRQTDNWSVEFLVWDGAQPLHQVQSGLAATLTEQAVRVQASTSLSAAKLLLQTEDGQTLEAPADLTPEQILEIPLVGLPSQPDALAVLDAGRTELLRCYRTQPVTARFPLRQGPSEATELPELDSVVARLNPATRVASWIHVGMGQMRLGEFGQAIAAFDSALLYSGDDPLIWWLKAAALRHLSPEAETDDLPNAHFLAPLEPVLRAEAYLRQPVDGSKEPNALLAPFEQNPEAFVEVAGLLLEAGLHGDASRFLDEALRHGGQLMLHYLQAYCYLTGSRMEVQAGEHVTAAGKLPFDPPFPWRPVEREAMRVLRERFPNDRRLAQVASLVFG